MTIHYSADKHDRMHAPANTVYTWWFRVHTSTGLLVDCGTIEAASLRGAELLVRRDQHHSDRVVIGRA